MHYNDHEILRLEESKYLDVKFIEPGVNRIYLFNELGIKVEGELIARHFLTIEGIQNITSLAIGHDSFLKNINVIKSMPNLNILTLYGWKLETLKGLEYFTKGKTLIIETVPNKKLNIMNLEVAPITQLIIEYGKMEDLENIGKSLTINQLTLHKYPEIPFDKLSNVPLKSVTLGLCKCKEISNTSVVKTLDRMTILGCRSLERFSGDNRGITSLLIDSCKKLDLRSINNLVNLESFLINTSDQIVHLSEFDKLQNLRSATFYNCKIIVDLVDLRKYMTKLEKITLKLKKDEAIELSKLNPEVAVISNNMSYLNGIGTRA